MPATVLKAYPLLHETKCGPREQRQGESVHVGQDVQDASWSSCSPADDLAENHAEHVREDPAEVSTRKLQKAARPSQPFRSKSLGATIVPEESASQVDTEDMDDFETKGGFRWLTSAGKRQVLKKRLPPQTVMSRIRSGRSERAVRAYWTNGILDKGE